MAIGDIGSLLDTLEFETGTGQSPFIVQVSGDVYACAYSGPNNSKLVTFTVDSAGAIGNAVIDTLVYDAAGPGGQPRIRNISGDIFAIVYDFTGSFTKIVTVEIDSDGNIGAAIIDSFTQASASASYPSRLVKVAGIIYACAHTIGSNEGGIFTVGIDDTGNIGNVLDALEYDTDRGVTADLIEITDNMFAIAYQGSGVTGWVATVGISNAGAIDAAVTATLEFDTTKCTYPRILLVAGNIYVIAYQGADNDGFAKTLTISDAGTISAVIATLEFETANCLYVDMTNVGGTVYVVSYYKSNASGFLVSFTVSAAGAFSAVIDSEEFEGTTLGAYPAVITIARSTIVCVVYQGPDVDGFAKTYSVEAPIVGLPGYLWIEDTNLKYTDEAGTVQTL